MLIHFLKDERQTAAIYFSRLDIDHSYCAGRQISPMKNECQMVSITAFFIFSFFFLYERGALHRECHSHVFCLLLIENVYFSVSDFPAIIWSLWRYRFWSALFTSRPILQYSHYSLNYFFFFSPKKFSQLCRPIYGLKRVDREPADCVWRRSTQYNKERMSEGNE